MQHHILIMGAAGCGSTSLAKAIAQKMHCPHFDTDEYYWLPTQPPYTQKRPIEEREQRLREALAPHPNWIISGVLCHWGQFIIPLLSHVIFLYADLPTRLNRIKNREESLFGDRILPTGDMHQHHQAFIEWASQYDSNGQVSRTKSEHLSWLTTLPCQVSQLDATINLETLIKEALNALKI